MWIALLIILVVFIVIIKVAGGEKQRNHANTPSSNSSTIPKNSKPLTQDINPQGSSLLLNEAIYTFAGALKSIRNISDVHTSIQGGSINICKDSQDAYKVSGFYDNDSTWKLREALVQGSYLNGKGFTINDEYVRYESIATLNEGNPELENIYFCTQFVIRVLQERCPDIMIKCARKTEDQVFVEFRF